MPQKNILRSTILGLALACSASAGITVVNTTASAWGDTSTTLVANFTYAPVSPGNTLVFGTYLDQNHTASNVLFDGTAADGFLQSGRSIVAYSYTSDASVDISINVTAGNVNGGYFLYELSGVDTSVAADLATGTSITTSSDNRFVVDFVGINFGDGAGSTVDVASILKLDAITDFNGTLGGGALGSASGLAGTAGAQMLGWNVTNTNTGEVSAAFAASAVPEPAASAVLFGFAVGATAVLRRRRRA